MIQKHSGASSFSRNPVCLKKNDYTQVEFRPLPILLNLGSDMAAPCNQDILLHRNNHLHMRCNLHLQADIL